MKNLINLTDKHILIIGASSGIGAQTALTLSSVGAKVSIVARTEEKLREVAGGLEGTGHNYFVFDISELSQIESLLKQVAEKGGPLDGMVYSAGILLSMPLQLAKPEKLKQLFDVNYFGFMESVRQATKKGRYNPGMRIVGVSAVSSMIGKKSQSGYSATKAAMDASVRCIARELAKKGIYINTVAPGFTKTGMISDYMEKVGSDSESVKETLARQYLGIIRPGAVAETIAFLLSPAAEYITGVTLPVDGGQTTC